MIRIGLVGENPNDTLSIKNLLLKKYDRRIRFYQLFKGERGDQIKSPKLKKSLSVEFGEGKYHFIIIIRDLDALKSQSRKLQERIEWFEGLNAVINNKGILLLNIYELEALILGDIYTFNKIYDVEYNLKTNPMFLIKPKALLKRITAKSNKRFKEAHCPDIFSKLSFDLIEKNCSFFNEFLQQLDKKIA